MAVERAAEAWGFPPFKRPWRWRARVTRGAVSGEEVWLIKPQTYMNRSGGALGPLLDRNDFDPERDLLVIVDEMALPIGSLRLRPRGSAGGHNGLKSIAGRLQSEEYPRMRIGVGPVPPDEDPADFVLDSFEPDELDAVRGVLDLVPDAIECWIREDFNTAMNRYNRRGNASD